MKQLKTVGILKTTRLICSRNGLGTQSRNKQPHSRDQSQSQEQTTGMVRQPEWRRDAIGKRRNPRVGAHYLAPSSALNDTASTLKRRLNQRLIRLFIPCIVHLYGGRTRSVKWLTRVGQSRDLGQARGWPRATTMQSTTKIGNYSAFSKWKLQLNHFSAWTWGKGSFFKPVCNFWNCFFVQ